MTGRRTGSIDGQHLRLPDDEPPIVFSETDYAVDEVSEGEASRLHPVFERAVTTRSKQRTPRVPRHSQEME